MAASHPPNSAEIEALRVEFEKRRDRLNAAKIAYLNRTPLDGELVEYDMLKRTAQELIESNYALQKAQFGEVKLKLSVARLLRRGR